MFQFVSLYIFTRIIKEEKLNLYFFVVLQNRDKTFSKNETKKNEKKKEY